MRYFLLLLILHIFIRLKVVLRFFYHKLKVIKLLISQKNSKPSKGKSYIVFFIKIINVVGKPFFNLLIISKNFLKIVKRTTYTLFLYSDELLNHKNLFRNDHKKSKIQSKVLFVTCVSGKYDELIDPRYIYEDADYFCFTDQEKINSSIWKPFWIPFVDKNPMLTARFVKWRMLKFFSNYDCVVWQDANIIQTKDISKLISTFLDKKNDLMLFRHPFRDNVTQELYACASQNKLSSDDVSTFEKKYLHNFDSNTLVETGLLLLNPKSKKLQDIMTQVFYNMSESLICRDQLFFPKLLDSSKINYMFINSKDDSKSVRDIGFWQLVPHHLNSIGLFNNGNSKQMTNIFSIKRNGYQKKVDIILPVYNAEKFTMRCIKSILPQLSNHIKLHVIDDFSEINFSNRLKKFLTNKNHVQFVRNKKNLGHIKTLNHGVNLFAKNDCFFIVNSDTVYPKYFFKNLTSLLFSSNDFSVVCSLGRNAGIFSTIKQQFNRFKLTYNFSEDYHYFNLPNDIHGACYGIKTDAVKKIGFLDEKAFPVGYGEENDYFLRLKETRKSVVLSLSTYFIHYGNQSFGNEKRNINKILGRKSLEGKHSRIIERYYTNVHNSNKYIQKIIKSSVL